MFAREFCIWLHGYFELSGPGAITAAKAAVISERLTAVIDNEFDDDVAVFPMPEEGKAHIRDAIAAAMASSDQD
jgi:hypothetical protein